MPQYPCSDVLSRVLRVNHLQLSDRHYLVLWRARCRSKVLRTLADEIRDEEKNDDENHAANDSTHDFWRVVIFVALELPVLTSLDAVPPGLDPFGSRP